MDHILKNTIDTKYVIPCYSRYQDFDFLTLISNYSEIEEDIILEIDNIILDYFTNAHYIKQGTRFAGNNRSFIYSLQFLEHTRTLYIDLKDDSYRKTHTYPIKIEQFGAIRNIIIHYPDYLAANIPALERWLHDFIIAAYTSLESAVQFKCEHIADKICARINAILINHLKTINKPHLINSARFFIFEKGEGFFYFDKEAYGRAIQDFKKKQSDNFSPFELLVWLITAPLPFAKSLTSKAFLTEGEMVWQQWHKSKFVDEGKFYESARKLYDLKPYAVISFCISKNGIYRLSIAFKKEDKEELVPELKKIRKTINDEFEKVTADYTSFMKKLEILKKKKIDISKAEVWGRFVGSCFATCLKILTHPH